MSKQLRSLLDRKEKLLLKQGEWRANVARISDETEGREMTAAENKRDKDCVSGLMKANQELGELEIEIVNEQRKIEAELDPAARVLPYGSLLGGGPIDGGLARRACRGSGRLFAEMFPDAQLSTDGFEDVNEFLSIMNQGRYDPRFMAAAGGVEHVGEDGGFIVPATFAARMMDASLEREIVRPRATIEPMTTNLKNIAGLDTSDHSLNIGGFVGKWVDEGGSLDIQKWKLTKLLLVVHKLGIYTPISNELIADAQDFDMKIGEALINAIGWYFDLAFLTGTGAGTPRGVLNDPALIVVTKEAAQPADTIVYENLTKMFARFHPALVNESVWVANSSTIPQLLNLQIKIKNVAGTDNVGGSHVPVLTGNARDGFSMLTRPVLFTEKLPALGDRGDILLAGFSQYIVGLRRELVIDKSMHDGFRTDETGYRAIARADGMGRWKSAITPRNGDSLSWCVTLEERA